MQDEVKVSQAAREFFASLFQHIGRVTQKDAHNICEGEWDGTSDMQMLAKFEQSIRHQAERDTLARMDAAAVIRFDRGTPGNENEMPKVISCVWMPDGEYTLYALPPAPEAGQ